MGIFYRPQQVREFSMCRGKRTFETHKEAQATHTEHRPYQCPICHKWHLTSKAKKKGAR